MQTYFCERVGGLKFRGVIPNPSSQQKDVCDEHYNNLVQRFAVENVIFCGSLSQTRRL